MTDEQRASAFRLRDHLFSQCYERGGVGVGGDRFHVYVYDKWPGDRFAEWEGMSVEWHVGGGKPRALASA